MKVYVPYTNLAEGVVSALEASGYAYTPVWVGGDSTDYWSLLSDCWSNGETFAIVEHDIVVRPESLAELDTCPYEWCSFGAPYFCGVYHGLGCVKFTANLIARHPNALDKVAAYHDEGHPSKHWCRLDAWLQDRVLASEYRHRHETVLEHAKKELVPSHGCVVL